MAQIECASSSNSPEQCQQIISQQTSTFISSQQAVCVKGAYLYYGSKKAPNIVLDKLNMTVPKGSIYGLLGASGCGKTTLLKCITGMQRLANGEIKVFDKVPGTKGSGLPGPLIGYMPQDFDLCLNFTIKETMEYFGWISGMTSPQIRGKIELLSSFLQLPSSNRCIDTLSGGQQRRVSLAVALIHDPDLLILDEPTCGVDVVLRERIWNYMLRLTQKGETTIIITTHYIEEMRQANIVALMRKGVLLAEDPPDQLIQMYDSNTLEDVFLQLSTMQSTERRKENSTKRISGSATSEVPISEMTPMVRHRSKASEFTIMKALLWKDLLWMWKNYEVIIFLIGLPVMIIIFFNLSIGQDIKDLHFAIYNQELNNSVDVCVPLTGCSFMLLSCRFLGHFQKRDIILDYYDSVDSIKNAIKMGHAIGAFHFPANFSENLSIRFEGGPTLFRKNFDVENSEINTWIDVSNVIISLLMLKKILLSFEDFIADISNECGIQIVTVTPAINFSEPVYGSVLPVYTDFAVPGMTLATVFFVAAAFAAGAIVMEKTEGFLERTLILGINSTQLLFGHVIVSSTLMLIQAILLLTFSIYVFDDTCKGDICTVFALTVVTGLSGMCFGFAITAATANLILVSSIIIGSMLPLLLLTGFIWPLEGMHFILKYFTLALPLTLPTKAMAAVMLRGWSITQQVVYIGFISNVIWIVIFLVIAIVLLKNNVGMGENLTQIR